MKQYLVFAILVSVYLFAWATSAAAQMSPDAGSQPVEMGLLNGRRKAVVKPKYPAAAEKAGISGSVKVSVTVDEDGDVTKAEAVTGDALLQGAAVGAALETKLLPTTVNGKPVRMTGFLVFTFVRSASSVPIASQEITLNSKARSWVEPDYPSIPMKSEMFSGLSIHNRGDVSIKVTIDKSGNVTGAEAVSGEKDLGAAAAKAALLAKFEPAMKNGTAVAQTGIVVYTFAPIPDRKDAAAVQRCKEQKFYICEKPLFEFDDSHFWDTFDAATAKATAKSPAEAEVDKLIADFDTTFAKLTAGLAAKDATELFKRLGNCNSYDLSKKQLQAIYDRLTKMDADKQPLYVAGRTEFNKRFKAFGLVKRPEGCTLYV